MKISVIIPTYNREKHLHKCLRSILHQRKLPYEIIVIDNEKNSKVKKVIDIVKKNFRNRQIDIFYLKNHENSGAVARNMGALKARGDLVAFLDDDVVLDKKYYYEIEKVFLKNNSALGVQGLDTTLYKFKKKFKNNISYRWTYKFAKFFKISSYFENERARVLPSLCVTHPYPEFKSIIQSEWISTCAGVFSRAVFSKFMFDAQLKKYSWNEYLDFSYSIYLENPKSLFITPNAKYHDVQTKEGRLNLKELIYMAEVYDLYIFLKRFDRTIKNILFYIWSKFGRIIYNIIRIIVRYPKEINAIFYILIAPLYALCNLSKIKKGNLSFFNKTLS
jgi:glycosyltransferase involved in cell wall biosynthesis